MSDGPCPECGTIDERGPHTTQNCLGVVKYRAAQAAVQLGEKLVAMEARAASAEACAASAAARTLELERRFPVTVCPKCGSFAKRGASHTHGFVMGSHVKYESCDGLVD